MTKTPKTAIATAEAAPAKYVADPAAEPRKRLKLRLRKAMPTTKTADQKRTDTAFRIGRDSLAVLAKDWKLFGGITLVYALLTIIFAQGLTVANGVSNTLSTSKGTLDHIFTGHGALLASSSSAFVYALGTSGVAGGAAGAYQFVLALIFSLVMIWALRQRYAGHAIRLRDAMYRSTAPLIPFVLVLMVIGLQFLPFVIGASLYATATSTGVAVSAIEHILWVIFFFATAVLSLYMITPSVLALYAVTLPGMAPMQALRSARDLVKARRWTILRKVLFLPLALLVILGVLVIPLVMFATPIAGWIFSAVAIILLPVVHSYMYALYRSLL